MQDRTIARFCAYFAKQNRKKAELSEVGTYKESEGFEARKLIWKNAMESNIALEACSFCEAKPKESGVF